ncbi:DNA replication/repair protein RecF [Aquamicrobium sp. LC103]|uniref:DNA replication/repair protein RecF n=1 Tax=Aquamicrobium sp. LC103 TaxID=1120658 RepID=UPI00063E9325|nr:DNA replication/repair protein RecF [Aquamicrobium sp. LC103]TKT74944.1 DNA replication/repair protein RecF [Aquamicrobium sp. LC103]
MPGENEQGADRPDGETQTHVARLLLTDFRNYAGLVLDFRPGAVVLTGDNGAGKTNLLEAISFLTPGRGLRRAAYDAVARTGSTGFAVHVRIAGSFGDCEIGTGTLGEDGETGRRVRINGASARSADEMLEWLRVIWLVPAMDALFTGPAAERRRFIDRLVLTIDPTHGRRSLDFEKAMRSRNRLLADNSRDDLWFEAIETQMAETGVAIAAARAEIVRLLCGMVERLPDDSPFPKADIALGGTLEEAVAARPAVEVEEEYRLSLSANRARDRAAGRTLDGPHRSDLFVRHRPKDMPAELCSTGEQKALLTGLVLSHARLVAELSGAAPILLLDEIAAHLDAGRRAALFGILEELNCQAFMTGTDAALFSSLSGRAQFFTVAGGQVTPA